MLYSCHSDYSSDPTDNIGYADNDLLEWQTMGKLLPIDDHLKVVYFWRVGIDNDSISNHKDTNLNKDPENRSCFLMPRDMGYCPDIYLEKEATSMVSIYER